MLVHPAFRTIFAPKMPLVKVLHVDSSISDLTTYTFTGVNLGDIGTTGSLTAGDSLTAYPHVRSKGKKYFHVIVHAEDALTVFDVSSVTIDGVAGTEAVDRAGATSAINTAMYRWGSEDLQGITSTDVVVTFSEAVTSCAIGVVSIENIGVSLSITSAVTVGTGELATSNSTSNTEGYIGTYTIAGITCSANETPQFDFGPAAGQLSPFNHPTLLYEGSNAEMNYAAAWAYSLQYAPATVHPIAANWSGAGAGDLVQVVRL